VFHSKQALQMKIRETRQRMMASVQSPVTPSGAPQPQSTVGVGGGVERTLADRLAMITQAAEANAKNSGEVGGEHSATGVELTSFTTSTPAAAALHVS
jgi:hypothetical protein